MTTESVIASITPPASLQGAVEAIQRAAVVDGATAALERGERIGAGLTIGNLARLASDGVLDLLASALILGVVTMATAIACVAYVLVPHAPRSTCPRCRGRASRVGETVQELGGGLLHQERLYYCPACRITSQEDVVLRLPEV